MSFTCPNRGVMGLEAELDTYSYIERREPGLTFRVVKKLFEQC